MVWRHTISSEMVAVVVVVVVDVTMHDHLHSTLTFSLCLLLFDSSTLLNAIQTDTCRRLMLYCGVIPMRFAAIY